MMDVAGVPVDVVAIGGGALALIAAGTTLLLRRRRRRPRIGTEEEAMADAAAALPGFAPRAAVVGHDGAAALVSGTGAGGADRLSLVRAGGARPVVQAIDWGAVRATRDGIVVEAGKAGAVAIAGADALDVRRLAPAASAEAIRIAEGLAPLPDISEVVTRPG